MGFFSKLKKVVSGVDKGAAIAAGSLPGKAGQIAGEVGQGAGVVTAVVQQIQSKPGVVPQEAQKEATLATAVAVDDHEERIKELEALIKSLQSNSPAGQGTQAGQGSQAGQGTQSGQGTQAGGSTHAGQGTQVGGGSQAGQGTQAGGGTQAGEGRKA